MPKLWTAAVCAVLTALFLGLVASTAYADEKPYFRGQNGDIFAGGWFSDGNCNSNYQGPTYGASLGDKYKGAIMGFAQVPPRIGASSIMGAFATGLIEGIDAASTLDYGVYSGLSGTSALSFANVDNYSQGTAFWGGTLEGAELKAHCIPDYFGTKKDGPLNWPFTFDTQNGQYIRNGNLSLAGSIPPGKHIVLFVNGNVTIGNNITYDPGSNINDITKFVLVVKGDIRVHPRVERIDGWYIAQPDGDNGGVVWTCHGGSSTPDPSFIRNRCDDALDVNGALTAKQINLARIIGGLSGDSAEDVNYTPEMVLGGPFFEDDTPGTAGTIQSLISLPPVF